MRHSDIHAGSGTVVNVQDPSTGMYLDLSFAPGQTHRALQVMLNGKLHVAYARLIKIEGDTAEDLILSLRVPSAPSDAPPVVKDPKPHPATVLASGQETRAGREAARQDDPSVRPAPSATEIKPEDVTRAAKEAMRDRRLTDQEVERLNNEREASMQALEPIMSSEELADMYGEAKERRQARARQQGSEAPGLPLLTDSDVDLAALPMSDEEVASLHEDAKALRTRDQVAADAAPDFVEPDAKPSSPSPEADDSKKSKKTKVTLR
jgi:hypothetical protein